MKRKKIMRHLGLHQFWKVSSTGMYMCKRRLLYKYFNFNNSIIIYSQVSEAELN